MRENTALEIKLYDVLRHIAKDYQTPDQIRRSAKRDHGLEPAEVLEYAYESIQTLAASAINGVRIKRPRP